MDGTQFKRYELLIEYKTLGQYCPDGIYIIPNPDNCFGTLLNIFVTSLQRLIQIYLTFKTWLTQFGAV